MSGRILTSVLLALALVAGGPAFAQSSGKRADVGEVSKSMGGDMDEPYGPTNLPRDPFTEDGRDFIYMSAVFVTAVRDQRPARTYSFWPRVTMSADATRSDFFRNRPTVRDAMVMALTQVAQIDWPGEAMFDAALASQVAQKQIDTALGGGKVDAIDFLHIEVQLF